MLLSGGCARTSQIFFFTFPFFFCHAFLAIVLSGQAESRYAGIPPPKVPRCKDTGDACQDYHVLAFWPDGDGDSHAGYRIASGRHRLYQATSVGFQSPGLEAGQRHWPHWTIRGPDHATWTLLVLSSSATPPSPRCLRPWMPRLTRDQPPVASYHTRSSLVGN